MLKVGTFCFTNTYPVFYALLHGIIKSDVKFVTGMPATINDLLHRGELDIAMVNSVAFLKDRFSYILLSDLGLASSTCNISVRLFYTGEKPNLNDVVYVPSLHAASASLLRILCKKHWVACPKLTVYTCPPQDLFFQPHPFLLIGDTCLQNFDSLTHSSIDITEAWHKLTKKSYITAVIATRNEVFLKNPKAVIDFHRLLEDSVAWGEANKKTILAAASKETNRNEAFLNQYFNAIEYRLLPKHFHGLEYFAELEASP